MSNIRLGIVGAGYIAQEHLKVIQAMDNVNAVGITSRTSLKAEDLARKYGLIQKLSSIRSVSATSLDYAKQKENFKNKMLVEAQKAIDEDGADSIIGYGSLDLITFLQSNLKVPVIEPVRSGVIFVESLIKLGISHSKRAFPKPKDYKL